MTSTRPHILDPLVERLPPALVDYAIADVQVWQWIGLVLGTLLALLTGVAVAGAARLTWRLVTRHARPTWDDRLVLGLRAPVRLLVASGALAAWVRPLRLAASAQAVVYAVVWTASITALAWAALRALAFFADIAVERMSHAVASDAAVRARMTQLLVLKRIVGGTVIVIAGSLALLQFEAMRSLGASLLASAGVAGVVVGFAAQRTIATLLAGLQISFTQPVRVGDVVVIEGEWGTIEEITLTYVVVKVWDQRRLIVPITRILDAPFQNWTRTGTEILGTAFIRADYRVDVEAVRRELEAFVKTRPEWDGRVVKLQVTDVTERTIELRALVSAATAGNAWDLRCAVREHLVGFLQRAEGGAWLPRTRIEPGGERGDGAPRDTGVTPLERKANAS